MDIPQKLEELSKRVQAGDHATGTVRESFFLGSVPTDVAGAMCILSVSPLTVWG
jgi:hypothetical protein